MKKNKNDISTSNSKLQSAHAKIQDTIKNARTKTEGQSFTDIDQFLNEAEKLQTDTDISVSITLSTPKFLAQANHTTPRIGTLHFEGRTVQNDPKLLTSTNIGALQLKDRAMRNVLLHPPTPSDVKIIKTYTASVIAAEMRAISSTQVWCSRHYEKSLHLSDINGQQINSLSLDFSVQGFVINNIGNFIVCDRNNKSIKQVTADGHVSTLCSTSPRSPWGICLNHKQQPVVCMEESLVVYSPDCQTKLQVFTHDQDGKPLFVWSYRVAMNGDTDYCVADDSGHKVVTIDVEGRLRWMYSGGPGQEVEGRLRWMYSGGPGQEVFRPSNICCDSHMHVIVADSPNHKVHLLDKEGQFIMYITDNVSIQHPRGLAVSDDDTLWIGENNESQKVHVIKYLKHT
ncbi:hypothetical protein FSP39_012779 [Pinctada imbricata]|uniref:Tripartite motif-containing protein 3 n=1 Tax=Pinctada imbricata TaxID=66713 RepID=A0AA88YCQ7_PINIB|nr:hypothetical protein FSP39_012779 [Pinctada imbricata]